MPAPSAGGVVYLYALSPSMCGMTLGISSVLWAVTLIYGDLARRNQKASARRCVLTCVAGRPMADARCICSWQLPQAAALVPARCHHGVPHVIHVAWCAGSRGWRVL